MSAIPRYKKLRNLLHDKIVSGKYAVGDRFLSQNELIKKYKLSFSTVNRALDELVREGYLLRETGKGTFIKATSPSLQDSESTQKNIFIFIPLDHSTQTLVDPLRLFKSLESLRPNHISIRAIPYSSEPDSLDSYLFSREPIHLAVFPEPRDTHREFIHTLNKQSPVLTIAPAFVSESVSSLTIDYASATADAVAYLIAQGHTDIAMITNDKTKPGNAECLMAYQSALSAAAIPYRESLIIYPTDNINPLHKLGLGSTPTPQVSAIIIMDYLQTPAILSSLSRDSVQVPRDLSVVSLDNNGFTAHCSPPLTCIDVSSEAVAQKILDLLPGFTPSGILNETLKCRFLTRQSTAPPSGIPAASK